MKLYKIYGIFNKIEECVYIGRTVQNIEDRYYQHTTDSKHITKADYLQDPKNKCYIKELYVSEIGYDIAKEEQYYINYYKPAEDLVRPWFNKNRAKKMSKLDKILTIRILKRNNNTNKGEFETDSNFDSFLDNC